MQNCPPKPSQTNISCMCRISMAKLSSSSSHSHRLGPFPLWFLSALRAARMKSKASGILRQMLSLLASFVKAKLAAVKSKTQAVKTQLIVFSLLHNRKVLMSAISDKIHSLTTSTTQHEEEGGAVVASDDITKMIVQYINGAETEAPPPGGVTEYIMVESTGGSEITEEEEEVDRRCPDHLRSWHSQFVNDEVGDGNGDGDGDDGTGSVIDLVKKSRRDDQREFMLEAEIDQAAELFIKRFHRQMMMQRQESLNRHQETLESPAGN